MFLCVINCKVAFLSYVRTPQYSMKDVVVYEILLYIQPHHRGKAVGSQRHSARGVVRTQGARRYFQCCHWDPNPWPFNSNHQATSCPVELSVCQRLVCLDVRYWTVFTVVMGGRGHNDCSVNPGNANVMFLYVIILCVMFCVVFCVDLTHTHNSSRWSELCWYKSLRVIHRPGMSSQEWFRDQKLLVKYRSMINKNNRL